jgi:hypothetical protein
MAEATCIDRVGRHRDDKCESDKDCEPVWIEGDLKTTHLACDQGAGKCIPVAAPSWEGWNASECGDEADSLYSCTDAACSFLTDTCATGVCLTHPDSEGLDGVRKSRCTIECAHDGQCPAGATCRMDLAAGETTGFAPVLRQVCAPIDW